MGAEGSFRVTGGAPAPDPERVAIAGQRLDADGPAAFAEPELRRLTAALDRALSEAKAAALAEASALVAQGQAALNDLDPRLLGRKRGLFDSAGKRLKAFRLRFQAAGSVLAGAAAELSDRSASAQQRRAALDDLWDDLRQAVIEIDACRAASIERCPPAPKEDGAPDPAALLRARLDALHAARDAGVRALPLVRAAQNAGAPALSALKALPDRIEAWRRDWSEALGLSGRKPKKVRPDAAALTASRETAMKALASAEAALAAGKARWAEVEGRLSTLQQADGGVSGGPG
jgi:hypothetical protein